VHTIELVDQYGRGLYHESERLAGKFLSNSFILLCLSNGGQGQLLFLHNSVNSI